MSRVFPPIAVAAGDDDAVILSTRVGRIERTEFRDNRPHFRIWANMERAMASLVLNHPGFRSRFNPGYK